tara:strand:+ start:395 stop:625 length:231 start_codon:yes stop_codon:yes gene_type:complete
MGFLNPRVPAPPPVEPPPPAPPMDVVPDSVVTSVDEVENKRKRANRVSRQSTILTGSQGLLTEAPIEYKSLLGSNK